MKEHESKQDDSIFVVVEIPKGTRNKYEYDLELGMFRFDRMLFSSMHYPSDYGFVMDTLAEDGDPLDAMVLLAEPTFSGCVIEAKPIGLFRMRDEKGIDDKILSVPLYDPQWNHLNRLADVPPHLLKEIEHFFEMYKELEGKFTEVQGWQDVEAAWEAVHRSRRAYADRK